MSPEPADTNSHIEYPESDLSVVIWIVPLVLAIFVPGARFVFSGGVMPVRTSLAVAMSVGVALVAIALLGTLSRGFRYRIRWALGVTTASVVALFEWPTLTSAGRSVADAVNVSFLADAVPVFLAVALLWLANRLAGDLPFAGLLSVALLAVVAAAVISGMPRVYGSPDSFETGPATPGSPDVVLLVLDGYPGADTLEETYEYDNGQFVSDLEGLGFEVPVGAKANYSFTYAAVASMLNLDYVFDEGELTDEELITMRRSLSGDPALYRLFHAAGYEVAYAENYWSGSYCGGAVDLCWRRGRAEQVVWNLGQLSILAPVLDGVMVHPFSSISYDNLKDLPDIVAHNRTDGVPRLTVVHVILPHPPFLLDESCARQTGDNREPLRVTDPEQLKQRRVFFAEQLTCTNSVVLDGLRSVLAERSDTIVMVTADHGSELTQAEDTPPQDWPDDELATRMEIFSAYRFPECSQAVYPTITPVNGIRLAANCALDARLEPVPDQTFWAPTSPVGHVTEVGSRLGY